MKQRVNINSAFNKDKKTNSSCLCTCMSIYIAREREKCEKVDKRSNILSHPQKQAHCQHHMIKSVKHAKQLKQNKTKQQKKNPHTNTYTYTINILWENYRSSRRMQWGLRRYQPHNQWGLTIPKTPMDQPSIRCTQYRKSHLTTNIKITPQLWYTSVAIYTAPLSFGGNR